MRPNPCYDYDSAIFTVVWGRAQALNIKRVHVSVDGYGVSPRRLKCPSQGT